MERRIHEGKARNVLSFSPIIIRKSVTRFEELPTRLYNVRLTICRHVCVRVSRLRRSKEKSRKDSGGIKIPSNDKRRKRKIQRHFTHAEIRNGDYAVSYNDRIFITMFYNTIVIAFNVTWHRSKAVRGECARV